MASGKKKFIAPSFFFILIGGFALQLIFDVTTTATSDAMSVFGFSMQTFIAVLVIASIPIMLIEYYLLAIPIGILFLFANRTIKAASYEMNIMNIGKEFSGWYIIRRAAVPALFSVASSTMFLGLISTYVQYTPTADTWFLQQVPIALMSALLFMPIALLIFMPTWVLNDTGIVTHLKENKQHLRMSPDTQGVGRWVGSIFGGYALIAFPIAMFTTHLYEPYIKPFLTTGLWPQSLIDSPIESLLGSFLLIIGLPLFVMAFIVPVVTANEISQSRVRRIMGRYATRLGATVVKGERIKKTTRFSDDGILTEAAGLEVVSTAKSVKLAQTKEKNLKLAQKEEKTRISKAKKRAKERSKRTAQSVKSVKTKKDSKK